MKASSMPQIATRSVIHRLPAASSFLTPGGRVARPCRRAPRGAAHSAQATPNAGPASIAPMAFSPAAQRHQHTQRRVVCMAAPAAVPTAEPGKVTLGFVGIGIMGLAMTNNLLKAGYEVVVWNRSADKCTPLEAAGAKVAATPQEVASLASITFGMLADPEAALAVGAGPQGVAAGMGPGKGYVDVSTVDAATSQAVAAAVRAAGGQYLEAPVSGSKGPAEQGTLIFLTAGDEPLFHAAAAPLDVMGKAKFFLGEVGAGANMKLVVNMIMGSMMASFAEGLSLAQKVGLSQQDLLDVLALGAISAPMFALKGPSMIKGSYAPAFPLKHQQKDLRLALALGDAAGQPLAVAAVCNDLYIRARAQHGLGDADFSGVLQAVLAQQAAVEQ